MRMAVALMAGLGVTAFAQDVVPTALRSPVSAQRLQVLVRMVRQDCGSCHGMRLTGGLGPALTREALADKPIDGLAATIFRGRPGTPMPGWRPMVTEVEANWIAQQLMNGFPEERSSGR